MNDTQKNLSSKSKLESNPNLVNQNNLISFYWFSSPQLGIVIALAMILNLLVAGLAGTLIPITLNKLKIDPALASGVILTTITDVFGFLSFLGLASIFII